MGMEKLAGQRADQLELELEESSDYGCSMGRKVPIPVVTSRAAAAAVARAMDDRLQPALEAVLGMGTTTTMATWRMQLELE